MNVISNRLGRPSAAALPLHSLVRLTADLPTSDGLVPLGTTGMIVHVFEEGPAYLVEFDIDHDPPGLVLHDGLAPIHG
jgi:hypothetical protein